MVGAMKRSHICPKCSCSRLLHLTQVADQVGEFGDEINEGLAPGLQRDRSTAWRIARLPVPPAEWSLWKINQATAGVMEAFVCRDCGYTELYTIDPGSIPVDGEIVKAITGPTTGPFR